MPERRGLTPQQAAVKRIVDVFVASSVLVAMSPIILFCSLAARADTKESGLFAQTRIGRHGKPFSIYKIRTMRVSTIRTTTTTVAGDPRITRFGSFLRTLKIDELPQFWNILIGDMSLVGPRPDVPGFADCLHGPERALLTIRPGITGPAALKYRREADLLASVPDPEGYNHQVVWPDKVRINLAYLENYSAFKDGLYVLSTVVAPLTDRLAPRFPTLNRWFPTAARPNEE